MVVETFPFQEYFSHTFKHLCSGAIKGTLNTIKVLIMAPKILGLVLVNGVKKVALFSMLVGTHFV